MSAAPPPPPPPPNNRLQKDTRPPDTQPFNHTNGKLLIPSGELFCRIAYRQPGGTWVLCSSNKVFANPKGLRTHIQRHINGWLEALGISDPQTATAATAAGGAGLELFILPHPPFGQEGHPCFEVDRRLRAAAPSGSRRHGREGEEGDEGGRPPPPGVGGTRTLRTLLPRPPPQRSFEEGVNPVFDSRIGAGGERQRRPLPAFAPLPGTAAAVPPRPDVRPQPRPNLQFGNLLMAHLVPRQGAQELDEENGRESSVYRPAQQIPRGIEPPVMRYNPFNAAISPANAAHLVNRTLPAPTIRRRERVGYTTERPRVPIELAPLRRGVEMERGEGEGRGCGEGEEEV